MKKQNKINKNLLKRALKIRCIESCLITREATKKMFTITLEIKPKITQI